MELINFLIEHFYFSAPLVIVLILFFISNSKKGGTKISCQSLISLSNQDQALIVDLRSSEAFNSGHITASINSRILLLNLLLYKLKKLMMILLELEE